jgi:hypothetical protein
MSVNEIYREALLAIIGSPVQSQDALELIDIALVALTKAEDEAKNGL